MKIINNKIFSASFWSILSEVVAKVISPVGFLILTRILSPEDFGVVAVATTILGFVFIVSEMGVVKVIIQEKGSNQYLEVLRNVGFWFNTFLGIALCLLMMIFSKELANFFGEAKSSLVICAMALQVLFYSLSSVQNANKRKELDFKFLFYMRLLTVALPLVISLPLAFRGFGYWAIVTGQVVGSFMSTVALWISSDWKPSTYFEFKVLWKLLSKSSWNTIEQIFIWIPIGVDTYLISNQLKSYDLGIYNTSKTLFGTAISLSIGAVMPVLYSVLSQINQNDRLYPKVLLLLQKIVFSIAAFMGVGVFVFRELIEQIIFNNRWSGISKIFGIIFILGGFEYFYSVLLEGLRAKGYFHLTAINTVICVLIYVPILFISIQYGLFVYVLMRFLLLYIWFPLTFYFSKKHLKISFIACIKNSKNAILYSVMILLIDFILSQFQISIIYKNVMRLSCFLFVLLIFLFSEKEIVIFLKEKLFGNNTSLKTTN